MVGNDSYDLAIIGAGAAGVGAAWSAARASRERGRRIRIALLDRSAHAGGVVTAALHRSLCGLYANPPADPRDTLNAGAARALVEALMAREPHAVRARQFGLASVLEFPPAAWPAALGDLCGDPQIDRQFGVGVASVERVADRVQAICTSDGRVVSAAVFIDATGTGQLLSLTGDDVARPLDADRPLGGFSFRLSNLQGDVESLRLAIPLALARAVAANQLPPHAKFATFYPGPESQAGVLKLAIPPTGDGTALADQVMATLRESLLALAPAAEVERSPAVQPRDGRRLIGEDTLTEAAVLAGERHEGEIALGWWPIEWWGDAGPTYEYAERNRPYGITPGMLRSVAVKNILAAGSCLSATGRAAASARVSGICLATGDGAGRMAAEMIG